jgi:hypothetical protein
LETSRDGIEKIEELIKAGMSIKVIDGKNYSYVGLKRIFDDPRPAAVRVKSLTGIVNFLTENKDGLNIEKLMIHVVDHKTVRVITEAQGEENERYTVIEAVREEIQGFDYGRFMDHELFVIKLASMFEETEDLATLKSYSSKVSDDTAVKTSDDGVTQSVEIKKGLSGVRTEGVELPSQVTLKPYRTFSECKQPDSKFLFRMKKDDGIQCALFEADGGFWKQTARESIAEFFKKELKDIAVIS